MKESIKPESLEIPVWWHMGNGRSLRRDALPSNHPESEYMYAKNVLKIIPEEYGILHETAKKYFNYSQEQLIARISELENYQR